MKDKTLNKFTAAPSRVSVIDGILWFKYDNQKEEIGQFSTYTKKDFALKFVEMLHDNKLPKSVLKQITREMIQLKKWKPRFLIDVEML